MIKGTEVVDLWKEEKIKKYKKENEEEIYKICKKDEKAGKAMDFIKQLNEMDFPVVPKWPFQILCSDENKEIIREIDLDTQKKIDCLNRKAKEIYALLAMCDNSEQANKILSNNCVLTCPYGEIMI